MGTKGGIWLMEVILEELNVPPKAGLEVELGTFVPSAAYVGRHHQEKNISSLIKKDKTYLTSILSWFRNWRDCCLNLFLVYRFGFRLRIGFGCWFRL